MYFTAPLAILVLTVGFLMASRCRISVATATSGIVIGFLTVVTLNFLWLESEAFGDLSKMGAVLIALSLPAVLAAGAYIFTGKLRPVPRVLVSSLVGISAVIVYPYVALILVCGFTGDCL